MKPLLSFDKTVMTAQQGERLHTLIELQAPPAPEVQRAPLDVVFVIDRSGSMGGRPIEAVREAVIGVMRQLGPEDRAGVVAFDTNASMILPIGKHTSATVRHKVGRIHSGSSTNLSAGWLLANEMLRKDQRPAAMRRIVLLTDGHVNQGIVSEDELATMVSAGRQSSITTSFIGFSDGYQEDLLGALANAGGGNDYWCEGADPAARVFQRELEGLATVVAQNVAITITPTDAVAVMGVLNDFHVTELEHGGLRVDLGDAFGDELRSLVVAFHLRPQSQLGEVEVAEIMLSWIAMGETLESHEVKIPITITAGNDGIVDNGADPRVAAEVTLLEAAKSRRESRRLADEGQFEQSIAVAKLVVDQLQQMPDQAEQLNQAIAELQAMKNRAWDATLSKQAYSASRQMSRKRASQFRDFRDDRDFLS
jgi:Ca-activated chloride channel family protein